VQFLYARVSTSDQTAAHQLQQARAARFDIDEDNVIKDEGVSGISTCFAERDGGRRLLDKLRAGDVLVVRWLDRLGRNYDDVRDPVQALMRKGVIVRDQQLHVRRLANGPGVHERDRAGPSRGH
jgi:putative DNA-invertase from lambdoid prophage Rac